MKKILLTRIAIVTALLTQVQHAAYVFYAISKTNNGWVDVVMSYVFAVSLELSIYIFTIEQRRRTATFFAVISILINGLYYWNFQHVDFKFFASLLISFTIPLTIWHYSDLISVDVNKAASTAKRSRVNRNELKDITKAA